MCARALASGLGRSGLTGWKTGCLLACLRLQRLLRVEKEVLFSSRLSPQSVQVLRQRWSTFGHLTQHHLSCNRAWTLLSSFSFLLRLLLRQPLQRRSSPSVSARSRRAAPHRCELDTAIQSWPCQFKMPHFEMNRFNTNSSLLDQVPALSSPPASNPAALCCLWHTLRRQMVMPTALPRRWCARHYCTISHAQAQIRLKIERYAQTLRRGQKGCAKKGSELH